MMLILKSSPKDCRLEGEKKKPQPGPLAFKDFYLILQQ